MASKHKSRGFPICKRVEQLVAFTSLPLVKTTPIMALSFAFALFVCVCVCVCFASPLSIRDADALVETVYRFSNVTVRIFMVVRCAKQQQLTEICSQVGRKHRYPAEWQDPRHFNQRTSSLADRPERPFCRACV